jgi:hypothetical protein
MESAINAVELAIAPGSELDAEHDRVDREYHAQHASLLRSARELLNLTALV